MTFAKHRNKLLLSGVVFLAIILRLVFISQNPPSLNWDEVSHGYNAYSILKTGKDEWGRFFPITNFRAYGDYPLPLNLYLTIPFIRIFGINEFSIRLPHAILGVLTVIASYYVAVGVTKKKKFGLITAFLVAVHPWYLSTSRFVNQSNLSIFLLSASMALFFNREKKKYFLPVSFFLLVLTLFSYHTTRIFSPLLLLTLLIIYRKEFVKYFKEKSRSSIISLIMLLLFFLSLPLIISNPESRARSGEVFLIDDGAVGKIIEERNASNLSPNVTRILYNRPVYFAKEFVRNYLGYFSPQYLFISGGSQHQFSVPGRGMLYLASLPFFYLGLLYVIKCGWLGKKDYRFIFVWLLLAPIPASITKEYFAVLRSSSMLPLPELFTSLGLFTASCWLVKKADTKYLKESVIIIIFIVASFLGLYCYQKEYNGSYKIDYSWAWQYGYKQVVHYAKENYGKYGKIIVTKKYGEPHEFFLFYWPWDPDEYRNDPNLNRFYQSNWYWVDGFDKFYFVNDWDIPTEEWQPFVLESGEIVSCVDIKCLLITSPSKVPKKWEKLETVNFLDGSTAFEIYEN